MDPITIISLVGTCASLATRVITTAGQIDDFLQSYRGADRAVASLSTTLRLFGESLTQMRSWLEKEPAVSHNLRQTIKGSVDDCEVVLDDLEEHVSSVLRSTRAGNRGSTLGSLGLGRKLKHIWNANTVAKQEARLNSQMQTVMHLINFVKLNNTDQQDSAVDTAETRTIISRSANEANIVRNLRDGSSICESRTVYTNVGDHDKELEVDEELIRSPAYLSSFRALMREKALSSETPPLNVSTVQLERKGGSSKASTSVVSEESSSRSGKSLLKSLAWSWSAESRRLVAVLCQATIDGNRKWVESLLDEGAYVNGWSIDEEKPPKGSSSDTPPPCRKTPLMLAVMHKRHEVFRLLLARGADLNAKDSQGRSVWFYIAEHDPSFCVELISTNTIPRSDLLTPLLFQAAGSGHLELVELLVTKGAMVDGPRPSVEVKCQDGEGPRSLQFFGFASLFCPTILFSVVGDPARLDLVKFLISEGADLGAKTGCRVGHRPAFGWPDRKSVTPLHVARGVCAEYLISKGASVFTVDSEGQTPLFWALGLWHEPDLEAVLANLAQGSPPDLVDNSGCRPLVMLIKCLSCSVWFSGRTLDIYITAARALVSAGAVPLKSKPALNDREFLSAEYQAYEMIHAKRWRIAKSGYVIGYVTDPKTNESVDVIGLGDDYHFRLKDKLEAHHREANWANGAPVARVRLKNGRMFSGRVTYHDQHASLMLQDNLWEKSEELFSLLIDESNN
ncbi:Ankyrin repeat-containing domain protein [Naviculisporaceae sp. PSN 640]